MQLTFPLDKRVKIVNWKVKEGNSLFPGNVVFEYVECGTDGDEIQPAIKCKFKSTDSGVVREILSPKGSCITKGSPLLALDPAEQCTHPIVLHDMCGVCSADLRKLDDHQGNSASVAMVHSVPGLKVSMEEAQMLGKLDEQHLIKKRKLVLLVDLDQTLIHTTNDNVPYNLEDVFHFQLRSHGSVWYHTRLRPRTKEFLEKMNSFFQLHICTFGTRQYANTIAHYLDPDRKYFSDRILSRDECFSQNSKTANLKELFPRGDHMVCIIDDREDVWNFASNLIHVKPYHFFRHTGDINAPPGLTKKDNDDKDGFEFPNDVDKAARDNVPKSNEADEKTENQKPIMPESSDTSNQDELSASETMVNAISGDSLKKECVQTEEDSKVTYIDSKAAYVESKARDVDVKAPETDSKAPGTDPKAPGTDSKAPDTDSKTPDADSKAPDTDSKAPDTDSKAPDTDSKTPDADSKAPNTDSKAPDTDSKAPDTDSKAPDTDSKAPDTDSKAPDTDSKAPDTDSKAPDTDSKAPDTDSKAPDTDSKAPDTDSKAPDTDAKAPDVCSKVLHVPKGDGTDGAKIDKSENGADLKSDVTSKRISSNSLEKSEKQVDNHYISVEDSVEHDMNCSSDVFDSAAAALRSCDPPAKLNDSETERMELESAALPCGDVPSKDKISSGTVSPPSDKENSEVLAVDNSETIKVEDPDDYLLYLEEILKSIHKAYYDLYDDMISKGKIGVPDVKTVIPYVRKKVLKGTSIVFSGVIPTHVPLDKSRPYAIALSLGAHVSSKIIPPPKSGAASKPNEPPTTHVVAAREGTAKVNEARKRYKGIHIVTPDWLWTCAERWERVDEKLFLLFKESKFKRKPPPHCSSPEQYKLVSESEPPEVPGVTSEIPSAVAVAGPSAKSSKDVPAARKERTPSGRFMDTINPLLTFSMDEIESMDHEVDDIFNESDSSSSSEGGDEVKKERVTRRKKPRLSPHLVEPVPPVLKKESSSSDDTDDETENETITREDEDSHLNPNGRKRKRSPGRTETETEDEPLSAKFRRGEPLPSDLDNLFSNSSDDDDDNQAGNQEDDWMAEALEREFLDEYSQDA